MKYKYLIAASISLLIVVFFLFDGCISRVGGNFESDFNALTLSAESQALIKSAYEGISGPDLRDYHTHVAGTGACKSGCFVNAKMTSQAHPIEHLKFKIYMNAAGIKNINKADSEYVSRLVNLIDAIPDHGKFVLLAFDKNYDKNGHVNLQKTEFFVPNEYVYDLSLLYPDKFIPCISIHPYRKDAIKELDKWGQLGIKQIKWLPNAMGMDPSDALCDSFYIKMKQYNMVLLSHVGHEKAVHAEEDQKYGNPLLLRKPLNMGVPVIMAHCASLGQNSDLDDVTKKPVDNFDLFIRMMDEEKYKGLLYGDISAMCQYNRIGKPLLTVLRRKELHARLLNGSDYPLPAINALIRTKDLAKEGYITETERKYLNEIYKYNPLLFDFVLKRTLKDPLNHTNKLSVTIFIKNPQLGY